MFQPLKKQFRELLHGGDRFPFSLLATAYAGILMLALLLAYIIGFDFHVPGEFLQLGIRSALWYIPFKLYLLACFGQFRTLPFYFRIPDLLRLFWACTVACVLLLLLWLLVGHEWTFPRRIILAEAALSLMGLAAFRLALRTFRQRYLEGQGTRAEKAAVAIIGAGDVGESLLSELSARSSLGKRAVVVYDDDPARQGSLMHGLPVLPIAERGFAQDADRYGFEEIIVAIARPPASRLREWVRMSNEAGLPMQIVPSLSQLSSRLFKVSQIRPVNVEDLLGREAVHLESDELKLFLRDRTVMVTGAAGSIGSEICRQVLACQPLRLLLVERSETLLFQIERELHDLGYEGQYLPLVADVTHEAQMRQILLEHQPQVVFHAAAHKHVPLMESQPAEAIRNNALGTALLARLCSEQAVGHFVLISTDKAINPRSVMGATKRLAEIAVLAMQSREGNRTRFSAVRFGNVLGSSGSVIPTFQKQIARGGPVTVTHPEMTRYFMTIPEAVGLVLISATLAQGGDILVLDMGQPVKIAEMARQMIQLQGLVPEVDIEIQYTGLRPGEKIHEELIRKDEHFEQTSHPRIVRFLDKPMAYSAWEQASSSLEASLGEAAPSRIKASIQQVIPEYKPF